MFLGIAVIMFPDIVEYAYERYRALPIDHSPYTSIIIQGFPTWAFSSAMFFGIRGLYRAGELLFGGKL